MKIEKREIAKNILLVVSGTVLLSFGTAVFIIPFELVTGGVSGYAIAISRLTGGAVGVDLLITLFSWGLFVLGALVLGRAFALKTLLSSVLYPIGVALFSRLAHSGAFGGFFNLPSSGYPQLALLLSALAGGLCVGVGCALTFRGGGSTGGVDIPAFIICRFIRGARSSKVIFFIDAAAVALGVLVMRDMVTALLGVISAFVCALAVDRIFLGGAQAFEARIISDKCTEIGRELIEKLHRTATLSEVTGAYSKERKLMLSVIFSKNQYGELMRIIGSADKRAFVVVCRAYEIGGEGWTYS